MADPCTVTIYHEDGPIAVTVEVPEGVNEEDFSAGVVEGVTALANLIEKYNGRLV